MTNKNNNAIEKLNANVRMALLHMRAYKGMDSTVYFNFIKPCMNTAFELFEIGWSFELWRKPYVCGMMSAAFKHAVADIAANTFIYDPDRVEHEEYLGWISEEERKLEALDLDNFDDWYEAMRSYIDYAGGLAPGHHAVYKEIERLIGN